MSSRVPPEELPVRLALVRKLILERCADVASARRAARLLERLEQRLRRPPRVVLLGEANSGKTSIANLLLGVDLLATDLVRNTRKPVLLTWAHGAAVHVVDGDGNRQRLAAGSPTSAWSKAARSIEVSLPFDRLKTFEVIDTPGLVPEAAALDAARTSCRAAHAAVWCTTVQQAWKASEVALWAALGGRLRRHAVLAVTQAGLIDATDRQKVLCRLEREAGPHFARIVMVTERAGTTPAAAEAAVGTGAPASRETSILTAVQALAKTVQQARADRATAVVHAFADAMVDAEQLHATAVAEPRRPIPVAEEAAAAAA